MLKHVKRFLKADGGNVAMISAIMFPVLAIGAGVAIDTSRLLSVQTYAQSSADNAALSVAAYLGEAKNDPDSECRDEYEHFEKTRAWREIERKCRRELRQIAMGSLDRFYNSEKFSDPWFRINIKDGKVAVLVRGQMKTAFTQALGRDGLKFSAGSQVAIPTETAKDVEIVLIADATGSMQPTISGVQDNMRDFMDDVVAELNSRGAPIGDIRIKFSFYRDFFADADLRWTGPEMELQAGLEDRGPLYESKFFALPDERDEMDNYIDFFEANGGGSYAESGLEAISYAMNDSDWGDGAENVRIIMLWTDAPNRTLHDNTESYALSSYSAVDSYGADPLTAYTWWWSLEYWTYWMGADFALKDYDGKRQQLYDDYYPSSMPSSLSAFKAQYDQFHQENSNGLANIPTMAINIIPNYGSGAPCPNPCGDWDAMDSWDGVTVWRSPDVVTAQETYETIVSQVADTVERQLVAKEVAIKS